MLITRKMWLAFGIGIVVGVSLAFLWPITLPALVIGGIAYLAFRPRIHQARALRAGAVFGGLGLILSALWVYLNAFNVG